VRASTAPVGLIEELGALTCHFELAPASGTGVVAHRRTCHPERGVRVTREAIAGHLQPHTERQMLTPREHLAVESVNTPGPGVHEQNLRAHARQLQPVVLQSRSLHLQDPSTYCSSQRGTESRGPRSRHGGCWGKQRGHTRTVLERGTCCCGNLGATCARSRSARRAPQRPRTPARTALAPGLRFSSLRSAKTKSQMVRVN
jgi:hypothetical protein